MCVCVCVCVCVFSVVFVVVSAVLISSLVIGRRLTYLGNITIAVIFDGFPRVFEISSIPDVQREERVCIIEAHVKL